GSSDRTWRSGVLSFRHALTKLSFSKAASRRAQSLRRPAGPGSCLRMSWHSRANCSRAVAIACLSAVEHPVECGVLQFNPAAPAIDQVDRRFVFEPREHEFQNPALAAEILGLPAEQPRNDDHAAARFDAPRAAPARGR